MHPILIIVWWIKRETPILICNKITHPIRINSIWIYPLRFKTYFSYIIMKCLSNLSFMFYRLILYTYDDSNMLRMINVLEVNFKEYKDIFLSYCICTKFWYIIKWLLSCFHCSLIPFFIIVKGITIVLQVGNKFKFYYHQEKTFL